MFTIEIHFANTSGLGISSLLCEMEGKSATDAILKTLTSIKEGRPLSRLDGTGFWLPVEQVGLISATPFQAALS